MDVRGPGTAGLLQKHCCFSFMIDSYFYESILTSFIVRACGRLRDICLVVKHPTGTASAACRCHFGNGRLVISVLAGIQQGFLMRVVEDIRETWHFCRRENKGVTCLRLNETNSGPDKH